MSRLFLKFFAWFVAANLLAVLVTLLLTRPLWDFVSPYSQQARQWGEEAVGVFEAEGAPALRRYLEELHREHDVYAVLSTVEGRPLELKHLPRPMRHRVRRHLQRHRGQPHPAGPPGVSYSLSGEKATYRWGLLSREALGRWHGIGLLRLALSLAVLGCFAFAVAWWIARPIRGIGRSVESLADGRLDTRVPETFSRRGDEIGHLAEKINHMAGRLEAQVETRKRLMRDVSHELRSPLARLEVALALAMERSGSSLPELERIETETRRLEALIDEVMMLSRLDDPQAQLVLEPVRIAEVVETVARDVALPEGPRLVLKLEADPVVQAERGLLQRAIENVVRNALKYSPRDASVELRVSESAEGACITVTDSGPGVAEAELGHIFRPFYRTSDARERETGGYGVGLAIVASVIERHGGTVGARRPADGGLAIEIRLPPGAFTDSER